MSNHIEFHDLYLGHGHSVLIKRFTAAIKSGEFITILGVNASGKTSLLRAILGLLPPQSGTILVFNQTPSGITARDIGYMPQARPWQTNYYLNGRSWLRAAVLGFKWGLPFITKAQRDEMDQIIEWVQADTFIDLPIRFLSGGQRQRLLLAQALLGQPKILLLDEPFIHLDPNFQAHFASLLNTIRERSNTTILLSSHDINPLVHLTDRVLYLDPPNALLTTTLEMLNSKELKVLYGHDIEIIEHNGHFFVASKDAHIHVHKS